MVTPAQTNVKRILMVDDDVRMRELLQRYLTEQGFSIKTVADSTEMDASLAEEHADLLKSVSAAVDALVKSDEIEKTARAAGLTYIAPQQPAVHSGLGLEKIAQ